MSVVMGARTCEGHQMLSFDVQNSKELCTSTNTGPEAWSEMGVDNSPFIRQTTGS